MAGWEILGGVAGMMTVGLVGVGRYWLYVRSVERYRAEVRDHAKVIEYAVAIWPWRRPP